MTDTSKIRRYYSQFPEWDRLDTSEGRLEFELSIGHLESHLIPGTRILDLGGGPGRYTIALAERGFQVFLAELSPELVSIAIDKIERLESKENVEGVKVVSALDLSLFEDNSFDSVVCFGPFYHLIQLQERQTAAAEIHRILKDDGLLFCSYIPRLSGVTSVIWRAANMPDQVSAKSFNKVFEHGIFENQSEKGFQEGYFYRTNEIVRFFESMGFSTLDVVAVQGLGAGREKDIYKIMDTNPELYEEIMRAIVKSSRDKAVVEFGGHCIYTGRKAKHKQWE